MNIFAKAAELEEQNEAFALLTIINAVGSTPRSKARMIVTASGECFGTIGGGLAESYCIEEAKQRIARFQSGSVSYSLTKDGRPSSIDMLCGGDLEVYIEVVAARFELLLVGGGHVNLEIARLGAAYGYPVSIVETREEFATRERFPFAKGLYVNEDIKQALLEVGPLDRFAVLIATHDHDQIPLSFLVDTPTAYLGMLGSRRKVSLMKASLREQGVPQSTLERIYAPAGLDIGSETPLQIAVSIIAEIGTVLSGTSADHLSRRALNLVVVRGAGDIASGTILRLHASGYRVLALETEHPTVIRRTISFATAVFDGSATVEGVTAVLCRNTAEAKSAMDCGKVAVLVDPQKQSLSALRPNVVVDAILAKRNLGTELSDAPCVIGLGPGFTAGEDCDMVIETNRGHDLGRVIRNGTAQKDTGIPGTIAGMSSERVLRAPVAGLFETEHLIADHVRKGDVIATVGDQRIHAGFDGVIRGLLKSGIEVPEGFKIGDVDPRDDEGYCFRVSDKARAVAGGVLEAIRAFENGMYRR